MVVKSQVLQRETQSSCLSYWKEQENEEVNRPCVSIDYLKYKCFPFSLKDVSLVTVTYAK